MPRAKVPRTAIEFVDLANKRGIGDIQRVFQCSRREAQDVVLLARRAVAQGDRYRVLEPPKGNVAVSRQAGPGRIGHAMTDQEIRELAAGIDPPELHGLTAEQRYDLQRQRQDQERRARNEAANPDYNRLDPRVAQHLASLSPKEREELRRRAATA